MTHTSITSTPALFSCCWQASEEALPKDLDTRIAELEHATRRCCLDQAHVSFVQLPIELADEILTDDGAVDPARCRQLRCSYLPERGLRAEHPNAALMHRVLQRLETDEAFRARIEHVNISLHPRSDVVLRATLGLRPETAVTTRMLKQCLLSALLSEVRQGSVGNCFGSAICIQKQHNDLDAVLEDLIELLAHGALTRTVEGCQRSFPFLLKTAGDCLQSMACSPHGVLGNESRHIRHCPVYKRLADAAGLKQRHVADLLKRIASDHTWLPYRQEGAPRVDRFIRELARQPEALQATDRVYARCRLAFDALSEHPLLAAWQNSVAGMAEYGPNGICADLLGHWFLRFLDRQGINGISAYPILEHLRERVRFLFDPAFSHFPEPLHKDYESGWVLYDTAGCTDIDQWSAVDTPGKFRTLIESLLPKFLTGQLLQKIRTLSHEQFFAQLHYQWGEQAPSRLMSDYPQLRHTPWVDLRGNSTAAVWKAYHNQSLASPSISLGAPDAYSLLLGLAKQLQQLPPKSARLIRQNSQALLSLGTEKHAFSLLAGREALRELAQAHDPEYWAWKHMIKPCLKLADSPPSFATRKRLIGLVRQQLIASKDRFDAEIKRAAAGLSLYALSQKLSYLVRTYGYADTDERALERLVLEALPAQEKARLKAHALPFADLNYRADWSSNKHQWLAFAFNPVRRDIDLYTYVRDQELEVCAWLNGSTWDFINAS